MNFQEKAIKFENSPFSIDLSKASYEAMDSILTALNCEVDEAIAQKRCPTLEGAYGRLGPSSVTMM